jgi:hypothetical protein
MFHNDFIAMLTHADAYLVGILRTWVFVQSPLVITYKYPVQVGAWRDSVMYRVSWDENWYCFLIGAKPLRGKFRYCLLAFGALHIFGRIFIVSQRNFHNSESLLSDVSLHVSRNGVRNFTMPEMRLLSFRMIYGRSLSYICVLYVCTSLFCDLWNEFTTIRLEISFWRIIYTN